MTENPTTADKLPLQEQLTAISREELRSTIRRCHQILWDGGKRSPMAAFGEFCKLAFLKQRDEIETVGSTVANYQFQRNPGETPEQLTARITGYYEQEKSRQPDVFRDRINLDPATLAQCVEQMQGISFQRTELDTKGVAFEEFMGNFFKGDIGQYFTPRELVAFAVQVLNPGKDDRVLDPACGSGGFLLYCLDHVRRAANQKHPPGSPEHFAHWHGFAEHNLFGIEINDELTRVAKMNMMLHDDGHTNIVEHDALDLLPRLMEKHPGLEAGSFDLILTNPPFGSSVKTAEKGEEYLSQFTLLPYHARRFPAKGKRIPASIKAEILYIERIHSFLKPGTGRAAVILPDGILTNPSLLGIRRWITDHFQITAVISLPPLAFSHYDAGVKASMLFLRRLEEGEIVPGQHPILMSIPQNIGYDATGRRTFTKTLEHEVPGKTKIERHGCDLFEYRIFYEPTPGRPERTEWQESSREIIPGTQLAGECEDFQRDPHSALADTDWKYSFFVPFEQTAGKPHPDYHHPERMAAIARIKNLNPENRAKRLADLVTFEKKLLKEPGENYLGLSHIEGHTGELTPSTARATGSCHAFNRGDVLFARLRPYLNKVYLAEMDGCCSTEMHVLRVRNHSELLPDYLAAVLRSDLILNQTIHMMTGNTHPRLTDDDVQDLLIPVPPMHTQELLSEELRQRRPEARRLQAEAEAIRSSTRKWFEAQVESLGEHRNADLPDTQRDKPR